LRSTERTCDGEVSEGFPPVSRGDARILILGSLPGERSIAEQQYYAHPRNAFWPIMRELFGVRGSYEDRLVQLTEYRIALWDVLTSSIRPGSLDSAIEARTARANDFDTFFDEHAGIELIAFNGKKAEGLYRQFVDPHVPGCRCNKVGLPSTSPAYAAMSFSGKLALWRQVLFADLQRTK
jgi:hypoxanthine-DNA glycosylase